MTVERFVVLLVAVCVVLLPICANGAADVLWDIDKPFPQIETIDYPDVVTYTRVFRATKDYQFLHGASVVKHAGKWYASWANSPVNENSSDEVVRGGLSDDGLCWKQPYYMIAPGYEGSQRNSHGVFCELDGNLWIFCAKFDGSDKPLKGRKIHFEKLQMQAFMLNRNNQWISQGIVADDFWPLNEPVLMDNGNWIIGGIDSEFCAAVAISNGSNVKKWEVVKIPLKAGEHYSETALIVKNNIVRAIMRNENKVGFAGNSTSTDYGKSWSQVVKSNYPMACSKPSGGILSTDQMYLVSNLKNRGYLVIAVGSKGDDCFDKVWLIKKGRSIQPLFKEGWAKSPQWSYPYCYENDGNLYIIYSVGKEDCEMAIVPITQLR